MRKTPLLFLSLLLAGCVATWPPPVSAQVKPAQGGTGAINTGAAGKVPIGNGTAFPETQIPDCDDENGKHLNFDLTTRSFSCGTSGSGAGVAEIAVEDPLEIVGSESSPTIGIQDEGIGSNKLAAESVGTSELKDGTDPPVAGECVKVAATPGELKYEVCTIGQMVVLHAFIPGKLGRGEDDRLWGFHVPIAIECPADFAGSYFYAWEDEATAEKSVQVKNDGVTNGVVTFEPAGANGSGVGSPATAWDAGDRFELIAAGPVDDTLEDVELTFVCTRAN